MDVINESKHFSFDQKKTLASTTVGFALENMDSMFLSFALSSMILSLHISPAAAGLTSTITNLGKLFGGLLFGILADRFGRVKIFSHTIFLFAIATGLLFFAHNIYEIYILRFLAGVGSGGEFGAGVSLISEHFQGFKVGKIISFSAAGGQMGGIMAAIIASIVLPMFGWNTLFLFGLIPVALAYFIRRHLKESPVYEAEVKKNNKLPHVSFSELFKTPQLAWQTIVITIMVIVENAGYYGLMIWLPTIMQKQLHVSISKSSLWMIATIVGISLGMISFGYIMDKIGPRVAFAFFILSAAVAIYGIAIAHSAMTLLVFSALAGFFAAGFYGGFGAIISRLYPTNIRTTANNMIMAIGKSVGGFSPVLMGLLMAKFSLIQIMVFMSLMYLVAVIAMLTLKKLRNFNHGYM
ncbi:MFS transporter [Apilactobacillus sp. F1]|nr:MFS transporter [Apilactobacillus sp. F1]